MEKIAFISGGTFIYWSSIILALAALTAAASFTALYLYKSGNGLAACIMVPASILVSLVLSRFVHWYCRTDSYESLRVAMTDFSWGGYALMGVFAGCIFCACLLRVTKISKNLPEMLDCLAVGGGFGIAIGRLASLFNASDRGVLMPEGMGLPMAYPVTNAVSGATENRLATFMLQAIVTGIIVAALLAYFIATESKKKKLKDGTLCLLFLAAYGGSQIVFDSTRYDSLFMRSNGFVSIVQILGAVALVLSIVMFSVQTVRSRGLKAYDFLIWIACLALVGGAGYMEYYVQRHGNEAFFAYSVMSACVFGLIALTVLLHCLNRNKYLQPA